MSVVEPSDGLHGRVNVSSTVFAREEFSLLLKKCIFLLLLKVLQLVPDFWVSGQIVGNYIRVNMCSFLWVNV